MINCGISVDKDNLDTFFKCLEGKSVIEAIAIGQTKLFVMPSAPARPDKVTGSEKVDDTIHQKVSESIPVEDPTDVNITDLFDDDEY